MKILQTHTLLEKQKKVWHKNGCSILSNGWTVQEIAHLSTSWWLQVDQWSFWIVRGSGVGSGCGEYCPCSDRIAYIVARRFLEAKYPTLFLSPCATHCIALILEDIGKHSWLEVWLKKWKLKTITKFIYNHTWVLSLMKEHKGGKEITRPNITRFASNCIPLQSLLRECLWVSGS